MKKRYNINISEDAHDKGVKKAKEDDRSFSSYIEQLIKKDCEDDNNG